MSSNVQNAAAHIITRTPSIALQQIHWLPIKSHIDFKIPLLTKYLSQPGTILSVINIIVPQQPGSELRAPPVTTVPNVILIL